MPSTKRGSRINNLLDSRKKLIAQFQQTGTNHNPNSHLDEKRSIITEALSKLDNEFIEKITQLVEDNLSSEKFDITYLSENESTDRTFYERVHPESKNAECGTVTPRRKI